MTNIDWEAYNTGYEAAAKTNSAPSQHPNPFEKGTIEFESFNLGWNSYDDDKPPPTRLQELTEHYRNEANWPPMLPGTRHLWRIMTPEQRAQTWLAPAVYHHETARDGMTENNPKARYNTVAAP